MGKRHLITIISFICAASIIFKIPQACAQQSLQTELYRGAITSTIFIGSVLVVRPLLYARKIRGYQAPNFVQKQAAQFLDTMSENDTFSTFSTWWKKKLGYLTVYQGANESYFKKDPKASAMTSLGIHFPVNSFQKNELTDMQTGALCHEVAHVYNWDTIQKDSKQSWYESEYRADRTTIDTLYKLKMCNPLIIRYNSKVSLLNSKQAHPYVYGTLDSLYEILKKEKNNSNKPPLLPNLHSLIPDLKKIIGKKPRTVQKRWQQYNQTYNIKN